MHAGPRLLLPGHSEATKLTPSLMPRCLLTKCGVKPGAGEGTAARRARRTSGLRTRGLSRKPRQPAVPGPPSAGPRPSASPRARLKPPPHGRLQAPAAPVPGAGLRTGKLSFPPGFGAGGRALGHTGTIVRLRGGGALISRLHRLEEKPHPFKM